MNKIHKKLAKKYGLPLKEIERICNSPFKFVTNVMRDDNDHHSILCHHLFKFIKKDKFLTAKSQEIK